MIADLAVPLVIDRARAFAGVARHEKRARWWLVSGVLATLGGVAGLTSGSMTLLGTRDPSLFLVGFGLGLGPLLLGIFLLRGARPSRWRAQAFEYATLLADARGAVSTTDLAPLVVQPPDEVAALLAEIATAQRFGWTPPPPFGTYDPHRYASFRRSRLQRAWWLGAFAFPFLIVSGVAWVLTVIAVLQLNWIVAGVMFLVGLGPGIPGIAIAVRARSSLSDRRDVGRLAIALLAPSVANMDDIVRRTGLNAIDARTLARAALQAGVFGPEVGSKLGLIQVHAPIAPLAPTLPAAPPVSAQSWQGRLLKGTWLVEAPLGAGGMGTVFRGRDVRTGHAIAVKIVSPEIRFDEDAFRRFHREAYALATLRHPAIVALRDYDRTEEGVLYLVMDLLPGETLETLLQRTGKLPLRDALAIAAQIGSALSSAHGAGLLHRDVKPSNIFVTAHPAGEWGGAGPHATLIDFGLVKSVLPGGQSRVTTRGQVVGTPLYMSPEQARGDAVDARSDLYSLAVVTYEMVTGVPPFFDPSIAVVYAKLLSGQVPSIKSALGSGPRPIGSGSPLEDRLDATLQRALSPLATDRHPTVDAFASELAWLSQASDARAIA